MEQILKNLSDPSWWFTGIFFVVVGILLVKLLFSWIPRAWKGLPKYFPEKLRGLNRWNKKRILLIIKNSRQKDMKIVWMIGRYWTVFLISFIGIAFVFVYFALSTDITVKGTFGSTKIFMLMPFYGLMLFTVAHKKTLGKVMVANYRWKRITRCSSKGALTRAA